MPENGGRVMPAGAGGDPERSAHTFPYHAAKRPCAACGLRPRLPSIYPTCRRAAIPSRLLLTHGPQPMPSTLFSPIRLGGVELENRIVVSPMCQYSAVDGCATDWHIAHLGMLANSGAGLVVVEATHVERHGRITHGCMGLYSDDNEAALARVVASARRPGPAKFGIQIAHAGRKGSAQKPWEGAGPLTPDADPWPTMAASPIPFGENWHTPREVTEADLNRVRDAFVNSAKRAVRIG